MVSYHSYRVGPASAQLWTVGYIGGQFVEIDYIDGQLVTMVKNWWTIYLWKICGQYVTLVDNWWKHWVYWTTNYHWWTIDDIGGQLIIGG